MKIEAKYEIPKLRKKLKMTQEQFAEKCGVSRQAVAKWEKGETIPSISVLVKIADTFNVSIDQLILGINKDVGNLDSKHGREIDQCKEAIIHRTIKFNYFDGEKKVRNVISL